MRREEKIDSEGRKVVHEYPEDDGPWSEIVRSPGLTVFVPKTSHRRPRVETTMEDGRILVDDLASGLVVWQPAFEAFDWGTGDPSGSPLRKDALEERRSSGKTWFQLTYQETYDESDTLTSRRLWKVVEQRGSEPVRTESMDLEKLPRR